MTNHPCPFSAGELLALGAIAETRSRQDRAPDGARRLAELCYQHARQHPVADDFGAALGEPQDREDQP